MKITGIKKAVGEYKRANSGGWYSPYYGVIMLDRNTGEVWTSTFYSLGHNSWRVYDDKAIINLVSTMQDRTCGEFVVNMQTVKQAAEKLCEEYQAKIQRNT